MKILVTGGGGFIGTNLCLDLLQAGHQVFAIDLEFRHPVSHTGFIPIVHDVIFPFELDIDQIYHLACHASPIRYQKDPIHTFKTCILGTLNALELAKKLQIPLLVASTSEIYGMAVQTPQKETYWGNVNPVGIRSCYNEGKRGAESLCMDFHRQYHLDVKIIRIFNTYGPFLDPDDGRAVPDFIINALQNHPLTIFGDGMQTRSFMFVDDLIAGMQQMMNSKSFTGPVNLGNPHEISILHLAKKILELTRSTSAIEFADRPRDDPFRRKPDIQFANELLDWSPKVSLEEGLRKTIAYFMAKMESLSLTEVREK